MNEEMPLRRRNRWDGVIGGATSFAIEAAVVGLLTVVAIVLAVVILALV